MIFWSIYFLLKHKPTNSLLFQITINVHKYLSYLPLRLCLPDHVEKAQGVCGIEEKMVVTLMPMRASTDSFFCPRRVYFMRVKKEERRRPESLRVSNISFIQYLLILYSFH